MSNVRTVPTDITPSDDSDDGPIMIKIPTVISSNASIDNMPDTPVKNITPTKRSFNIEANTPTKERTMSLRRNTSFGNIPASNCTEAKVLVIYTGGTIGMIRNKKNGNYNEINSPILLVFFAFVDACLFYFY